VKKEGGKDVWHIKVATDMLAAGHERLSNAIAEVVRRAMENGWVDKKKTKRWLEKLEKGRVLKEGWPKYNVRLVEGALMVRYRSTSRKNIGRETKRFRNMGLEEGRHFSVKMPEEGHNGYVRILKEGLERAAWLSEYGSGRQRELAAEFVEYILQRAEEAGDDVYEKAEEIVKEGKAWGILKLKGFEGRVEVGGSEYVVKVIDGGAVEEGRGGKKLLRIRITAEVGRVEGEHTIVDRVVREYTITFGRYGKLNAALGYAYASADVPGGREALADAIEKWLEETGR
jgi:hypothetical protein